MRPSLRSSLLTLVPAALATAIFSFSGDVTPRTVLAAAAAMPAALQGDAVHEKVFTETRFPSAVVCGECHPKHYREWSVSQHAYAQLSPIFNAMSAKIGKLTNDTNGDFCVRCHTQVGMNLDEETFMSNIDRHPTSREGITCIVCHRVNQAYGKISGRLAITEGDLTKPIQGPRGDNTELNKAIAKGALVTDPNRAGRKVHAELEKFFTLTTPGFCGSCHDVTLANGFRLEEAFSEFKAAPAARRGITCQDCHMGKSPGKVLAEKADPDFTAKNYQFGSAAKVGSFETAPRKLTDHRMIGPDYSVMPVSLFPLNIKAIREEREKNDPKARGLATIREWLTFDWKAGWGTDAFEDKVAAGFKFPERWSAPDDRNDARAIIDDNVKLLAEIADARLQLLKTGYVLGDVQIKRADPLGVEFKVQVKSGTDGHNVPTGFDAERLVWLYVRVVDAAGVVVHQSGNLDPNGDVRDLHSAYVHNHELPIDEELLSLQSKFVTRMLRGGEREQVLAVNTSPSAMPYVRPERQSDILLGRPGGARKQKNSVEPGGSRWATYTVSESELKGKGPYRAIIQLKAAMVPVNLVNEVRDIGFDYGMSARQIADNLVAGHQVIWEREVPLTMPSRATKGAPAAPAAGTVRR
jgi:hypothetical protein